MRGYQQLAAQARNGPRSGAPFVAWFHEITKARRAEQAERRMSEDLREGDVLARKLHGTGASMTVGTEEQIQR